MADKALNAGLMTAARGAELIAFGFRIDGTSDPDALWQCGSNAVTSVVRTSAGLFTVQMNKAYPREIVAGSVDVQVAAAVATGLTGFITRDSYDKATGIFTVGVKVDAGTATDPADNDIVTVILFVQRVDQLVTSHGA